MTKLLRLSLIALLILSPLTASAELFKCKKPDGNYAFQDHPCPKGASEEQLQENGKRKEEPKTPKDTTSSPKVNAPSGQPAGLSTGQSVSAKKAIAPAAIEPDSALVTSSEAAASNSAAMPIDSGTAAPTSVGPADAASTQASSAEPEKPGFAQRMGNFGVGLLGVAALVVAMLVLLLPMKFAAKLLEAERSGLGWCFLAVLVSVVLQAFLQALIPFKGLAILPTALAFMAILKVSFPKALAIAALTFIFYLCIGILFALIMVPHTH